MSDFSRSGATAQRVFFAPLRRCVRNFFNIHAF
jgi:hypothetical protein